MNSSTINDKKHARLLTFLQYFSILLALLSAAKFFKESYIETLIYGGNEVIGSWDGAFYYFWLRSLAFDGDVNFYNEVLHYNNWSTDLRERILSSPVTEQGLIANKYSIGWAITAAPWFALAHLVALAMNTLGFGIALDGYSLPYQFSLALGQLSYAALSLYFSYQIVQSQFSLKKISVASVIALTWLSSFMLLYQTSELFMAHNATFFSLTLCYFLSQKQLQRQNAALAFGIGFSAALLILCRPQAAVFLLYPGIVLLRDAWPTRHKGSTRYANTRYLFLAGLSALALLSLQMFAWKALYGSFILYSYSEESFYWSDPQFAKLLFSEFHGLFYWHPVFALGFIGCMLWVLRSRSLLALSLLGSTLLTTYINASWHNWWFGVSFGSRAFECSLLTVFAGIAYLYGLLAPKSLRVLLLVALFYLALWNIALTALSLLNYLPLDRAVTHQEMRALLYVLARHQFPFLY